MKKALIITALIVGIFLSIQMRSFKQVEILVARSGPANLIKELRVLQVANQQLRDHIAEKEKSLEDIKSKISSQTIEDEIKNLRALSGTEEVSGEGIEIVFPQWLKAFWLSDLIAQLVSAGAEAVAINDIRFTENTAGLRDIGNDPASAGLLMRSQFLRPPFKITVIGPKVELKQAISQSGGILDRIGSSYGKAKIIVTGKDTITIPALTQ
ncbi:MAG: DUF881 domain-containing protein [Patescibacteria group bacterium]